MGLLEVRRADDDGRAQKESRAAVGSRGGRFLEQFLRGGACLQSDFTEFGMLCCEILSPELLAFSPLGFSTFRV